MIVPRHEIAKILSLLKKLVDLIQHYTDLGPEFLLTVSNIRIG